MRREEEQNSDIKKFSKKQCNEKMKPFLREPLRLCVEKDIEIMHTYFQKSMTRCYCPFSVFEFDVDK